MKTILTSLLFVLALSGFAQEIKVNFTGIGAVTTIDSITATNFTTDKSITFPGNETLILSQGSSTTAFPLSSGSGIIFPNPFSEMTSIKTLSEKSQSVIIRVINLQGQIVEQAKDFVLAGENEFTLFLAEPGIFFVTVTSGQKTESHKIISLGGSKTLNRIVYRGATPGSGIHPMKTGGSLSTSEFRLGYAPGDVVHYRCLSGIHTTILTDSAISSKNYQINFAPCTDADGLNYSIIKIGSQTWMAENLAYLPYVNRYNYASHTEKSYYVYNRLDTSLTGAKSSEYYKKYGVLYNWVAAKASCPKGWHLPTIAEWNKLIDFLYNNFFGYGGRGNRIAKSLASRSDWNRSNVYGSVGYDLNANNKSGFNALPGGFHTHYGSYYNFIKVNSSFWSADPFSDIEAWSVFMTNAYEFLGKGSTYSLRYDGLSVRCLKD